MKTNEREEQATTTGGLPLLHNNLTSPPIHIPDEKGGAFKTELTLFRTPEATEKILWWHGDDPRTEPHNHPWDFVSEILFGGYTEDRYWVEDGTLRTETITYRVGDKNTILKKHFHVVRDVLPGTFTNLKCGKATPGNEWGYLDLNTLEYTKAKKDPDFFALLQELNPHLR